MNITQEQNPTNVAEKTSKCILSGCSCLCHSMDSIRMEGRGPSLLSPRRIKSLKCVVVGVVVFNVLLFLTLTWETGPNVPNISSLQRGLLGRGDQEPVNQKGTGWQDVEMKKDIVGGASENAEIDTGGMLRAHGGVKGTDSKLILAVNGAQKSACFYRTAAYVNNRHIKLTQPPFLEYVNDMTCLEDGNIAVFSSKFARFNNVIIDSSKTSNKMKGGENMEDVWNQKESDEYFTLLPGFFTVPCSVRPNIQFSGLDHLSGWSSALRCYAPNAVDIKSMPAVRSPTLAIQRYEYVNLYHTMTDFYNAFVLMLIFGIPPSKLNILFVDAHPVGKLDEVWGTLFGKYMRAGHLKRPTVFHNLAWGFLGYSSPLNHHERAKVPYLEEFREFFLTRHNVSDQHKLDCKKLNVILIWRRDYVAHPRNPKGSVVRKFANEEEMVEAVKKTLGESANVEGIQLDALPMRDQLEKIVSCDILIGMHGAGLSHTLFLPSTSGVIEYKPQYSNPSLQHFHAMAKWRNLPYTIWHNFDDGNEKSSYRTRIPPDVVGTTVKEIYGEICR